MLIISKENTVANTNYFTIRLNSINLFFFFCQGPLVLMEISHEESTTKLFKVDLSNSSLSRMSAERAQKSWVYSFYLAFDF